jgi:hypothetical protein
MKKALVLLVVAMAIPTSVAFAKGPGTHGKSHATVMYVLKGTLSSYTAATSSAPGSISILVKHSNFHNRLVTNAGVLVFPTTMSTRVTFKHSTTNTIIDGAKGIVKFKGPLMRHTKDTPLALASTLTSTAKALHIIDQSRH